MSPDILLNVKKNIELNLKINPKRINKLLDIMKSWNKGTIVYPNKIKSDLALDFPKTYMILDYLKEMNLLQYAYQIYCFECGQYQEYPIMNDLRDFPKNLYCDKGHKLSAVKDVVLLYRVKYDG